MRGRQQVYPKIEGASNWVDLAAGHRQPSTGQLMKAGSS
ncbi:hypothetical protein QFZ30_003558 [Arthrobacter pascens]|nr:hypothetical protein [Arthrobacter pascens]